MNSYDRSTFYTQDHIGYTDYPFSTAKTPKYMPSEESQIEDLKAELHLYKRAFDTLKKENEKLKMKIYESKL